MIRRPLSSTFTFALSAAALISACADDRVSAGGVPSGTETDNPVVDTASPSDFVPPGSNTPPPCPGPSRESLPNLPIPPHAVLLPGAGGHVLAVGDYYGLRLIDMSDPAQPVTLGTAGVRGAVDGLLLSSTGQLWVAAEEDPIFPDRGLGTIAAVDPESHLIAFDVSDPSAPVRLAEATLGSGAVDLRERGGAIWALTTRLSPEDRGCDAVKRFCGYPGYEAVELHGFRADGSALTEVAAAELPFATRVYFGDGGLATTFTDGSIHVLPWDDTGALGAPVVLRLAGSPNPDVVGLDGAPGPVEMTAGQVSVVNVDGERASLQVFDLATTDGGPSRSADLGAWMGGPGSTSLFDAGRLWLVSDHPVPDPVAIWDVSAATPTRLALPAGFSLSYFWPIRGATLGSAPGAEIALGLDSTSGTSLFAIDDQGIRWAQTLTDGDVLSPNYPGSFPAPAGLVGSGDAAAWQIVVRGAGLPLGIDPAPPPVTERVLATVAVTALPVPGGASSSTLLAEAALLDPISPAAVRPNPVLEVTRGTTVTRFAVSPGAERLISSGPRVVVIADRSASSCAGSRRDRDCDGYAPGVEVFDLSGEPQRSGALAFPDLGLPTLSDTNYVDVNWQIYDPLSRLVRDPLPMDASHLAFVGDVDISCDTDEECAAFGITPVPFAQAGVITTQIEPCPPGSVGVPGCELQSPPLPTVYGTSHRQYFLVLALDDTGGPAWHILGTSVLESNSGQQYLDSSFALPVATPDSIAATRLERKSSTGELLPSGQARFMFDRFKLQPNGSTLALAPVNVPGYPLVRLSETGSAEQWLSVEGEPDTSGASTLHLLRIETRGAEVQQSLTLDASFGGLVALELAGGEVAALALTLPSNACGTSLISAVRRSADGDGISVTSKLELPSDDWSFQATSGARALLVHGDVYAVVELSDAGELGVVALRRASDYSDALRLLATEP